MDSPQPADHALVLAGVFSGYGGTTVLRDVSLSVAAGGITCILGRNGVGKSTLMKTIMGLLPLQAGTIDGFGTDITRLPTHERARRGIAYVPQGREVFPQLTVEENLRVNRAARCFGEDDIPDDIFVYFPALRPLLRRRAGVLSGGQQQQLALARAMASMPKIMLLDEPTEGLQPNVVSAIQEIIVRLNTDKGISVVLVEQKIGFARRVGSLFHIIEKGTCVASGPMGAFNDGLVRAHLEVS